jgi:hypothetical protein
MKCAVCGRENKPEAFHCYVCHSRELGNQSPSEDYRASQEALSRQQVDELLSETIETYNRFPGTSHKLVLIFASVTAVLIGLIAFPGPASSLLFVISAILFSWVALILRITSWRVALERKRRNNE